MDPAGHFGAFLMEKSLVPKVVTQGFRELAAPREDHSSAGDFAGRAHC